jgi:hypothetical protein
MQYFTENRVIRYTQHCAKLDWHSAYADVQLAVTSWSAHCQGKYCLRVFKFFSSKQRSQSRHEELKLQRIVWESKFNQKVMRVPPEMSWSSFLTWIKRVELRSKAPRDSVWELYSDPWMHKLFVGLIRRTACARAQFSRCSSTTNAQSETGQMAVYC